MKAPGWKTLKLTVNRLRSRMRSSVLILGYHRVANELRDPYQLCVSPVSFAEQVEVLSRKTHVIDLETLQRGLADRSLPRRAVAITFDDGYADTLYAARPLLSRHELPFTVFVVAGGCGQEFWWDRLQRLILSPALLPETLEMTVGRHEVRWRLLENGQPPGLKNGLSGRRRLLNMMFGPLQEMSHEEKKAAMDRLQEWVEGASPPQPVAARSMTPTELQDLAKDELVTVGAHTVVHQPLPAMTEVDQEEQISTSKEILTKILEQPVNFFSYPHGAVSQTTRRLVEKNGFRLACASHSDAVFVGSDPFALPRFWIPDWNGEEFSRWLHGWFS
jgi:peptidoglycan/xylan/chitin deacetylase (PgdA/CDA1 family)